MKKVYLAIIRKETGGSYTLASCFFTNKKKAIEWIQNHRNRLEEDLYLLEGMNRILWSTSSTRERNQGHVSRKNHYDYIDSFAKYRVSPFSLHIYKKTDEFSYRVYTFAIGNVQAGVKCDYKCDYKFGEPIIDVDRVEQKLSEYKQHREEIRK